MNSRNYDIIYIQTKQRKFNQILLKVNLKMNINISITWTADILLKTYMDYHCTLKFKKLDVWVRNLAFKGSGSLITMYYYITLPQCQYDEQQSIFLF